jgi:hypothetical protein
MFFYPLRCSCTLCRSIQVLMKLFFFLYYRLSWALDTIMPLKCGTFSIKNISSIYMKLRCHIHLTIKFSFWTYFKNKFWSFHHLIHYVVHLQHLKDSFKENFLFCINILLTLLPVRYLFSMYAIMFFVCKITVFSDSVYKDTKFSNLLVSLQVCWKDVIHWMWPLFTENWGSWRNDDLHLSPCPFTVCVSSFIFYFFLPLHLIKLVYEIIVFYILLYSGSSYWHSYLVW